MSDEPKRKSGRPKGRTAESAKGRVADYRPAQRTCLLCGKPFASQGPGNRKCDKCRGKG